MVPAHYQSPYENDPITSWKAGEISKSHIFGGRGRSLFLILSLKLVKSLFRLFQSTFPAGGRVGRGLLDIPSFVP